MGLELAGGLGSVWEVGSAGLGDGGLSGRWAPQGHEDKWGVSHDSMDFGLSNRLFGMPPSPH